MFDRILVPIDGSSTALKGVAQAIAMAKLTGGCIKLMHVFQPPLLAIGAESALMRGDDIYDVARDTGLGVLSSAADRVRAAGVKVEEQLNAPGGARLCDQVVEAATKWDASLIVLGSHGRRGVSRALLGSDAEQILRIAPVPVLLVRDAG